MHSYLGPYGMNTETCSIVTHRNRLIYNLGLTPGWQVNYWFVPNKLFKCNNSTRYYSCNFPLQLKQLGIQQRKPRESMFGGLFLIDALHLVRQWRRRCGGGGVSVCALLSDDL